MDREWFGAKIGIKKLLSRWEQFRRVNISSVSVEQSNMAANMSLGVEKLNNFNYELWKFRMELLLLKEGVKNVVDDPVPQVPTATWLHRDGKARALIGLSIDDSQTCHVLHAATARDMWLSLKNYHARSSLATKIHVLRKLFRMHLADDGNMAEHLSQITQLANRLSNMGNPLKDHWLVAIILSSLNDSYDSLITSLESRPKADLQLEFVKRKLLDEWRKRLEKAGESASGGSEKVLKTVVSAKKMEKKKEKVCHYCGKEGHFRRECRKLEYDRKNKEKDSERSQKANVVIEDEAEEVCMATGQLDGESGEVV